MEFITLAQFANMLCMGSRRIIENRKKIDAINVFPVADNDTGSNLASTFLGVRKILEARISDSGHSAFALRRAYGSESSRTAKMTGFEFADEIIKSAFENSKGNSGIMMASFLKGFLLSLKNKDKIFLADLAKAAKKGEETSRDSVEKPVRGTMLDVMEAFSLSLQQELHDRQSNNISLTDIFYKVAKRVRVALIDTQEKLKILKINHVVDAGALGFTYFIFGLYEGLSNTRVELSEREIKTVIKKQIGKVRFAHEVVFTVQNTMFSILEIRSMLSPLGDSIEILEMEEKIKIHIHTDKPEAIRETASLLGKLEEIKIIDMRIQILEHFR